MPLVSRHPVLLALAVALAPALWAGFVGSGNPHELAVGLVAAAATVCFTVFVCRSSAHPLALRPRDLAQLWRMPWYVLSGCWVITRVLFRDLAGLEAHANLYRVCAFDSGHDDPLRNARTVLAVTYTTASPNFIVLGVDSTQSRMIFYQIARSPVPRMTKALGARA